MLGAASIPMATSAAAATQVQTIEAPLEPGEPEAAAAETTAATPADQAAPEQAATEAAAQPAAAAPAAAPAAPAPVGAPAPPVESLPGEVSDEEMASIEQQYSQEQQTLASEQQQLAVAQQEQAQADQSVVHAQSDILIAQHQVDSAQATLDSATAAQDYAEGRGTGLTDEEQAQAQQSVDEAEAALAQAQQDLATAQGNLAEAQEAAAAAAATTAAQQSVVDVETSNANAWTAFYQQADARHPEFVAPVEGYEISTHYGEAGSNWSSGHHTGTDFAAPAGTEVQAVADGTVIFAGTNGPYGNQVQIQHSDGTITTYSHLSEIDVSVGESVAAGDQIGLVGTTGNSTGPHLHFEVHDANGNTMDSDAWLAQHGIA
jgi:murein DD-endopeptidase MepM/ murein hydrolase activator NlpD